MCLLSTIQVSKGTYITSAAMERFQGEVLCEGINLYTEVSSLSNIKK